MPRKANVDRPRKLTLHLGESILARLDLYLYSEVDSRIPVGSYARFFTDRIREFFGWTRIDLALYGFPPGYFVAGPREMVESLKQILQRQQAGINEGEGR